MRKLLNKPWFVAALALIACAVVWNTVRSRPAASIALAREEAPTPSVETPEIVASAPVNAASMDEVLKGLNVGLIPHDPFAARSRETASTMLVEPSVPDFVDTVKLSAIWMQEGRAYVLINGQIHQVGDEISRLKIESVSQDGVWLAHWKGRDFVALGADFTLVTPSHRSSPVAAL